MTVRRCVRVLMSIFNNEREFRIVINDSISTIMNIHTLIIIRYIQNPIYETILWGSYWLNKRTTGSSLYREWVPQYRMDRLSQRYGAVIGKIRSILSRRYKGLSVLGLWQTGRQGKNENRECRRRGSVPWRSLPCLCMSVRRQALSKR